MVELVALLPRKPGMSKEDFHRHWRERHGPLVVETLGRHLVAYEQRHRLAADDDHDDGWDGVAIQRFESKEAFDAFMADPAFAEKVIPDQDEFIDMERVVWFLTEPPEVFV
ncbi:MAG: EthD domain [Acidimicrobiales bacterium]|nr:EthD domain [Acidimicrobiales bacterium]